MKNVNVEKDKDDDNPISSALKIVEGAKLFHDCSGITYLRFNNAENSTTWPIKGSEFRRYLRASYFREHSRVLPNEAASVVEAQLDAEAAEGATEEVWIRVGEHGGKVFIDLVERVIAIGPDGWKEAKCPPVNFIRPASMKSLPKPLRGKRSLRKLLEALLPQMGRKSRLALAGFLLGALRPKGPYMLLQLLGPQGSGKSTLAKMAKQIIDPSKALARAIPSNELDLIIAASRGWILCLDNVSQIRQGMSDVLCRLATGGGFGTRKFYTNEDEVLFDLARPVIVNGIGDVIGRADLKDRTLPVVMPTITGRRSEAEIWKQFDEYWPLIVGALFDCASAALRNESSVDRSNLPRMADWFVWVSAALPTMGFTQEELSELMADRATDATDAAIEASPVAGVLLEFMRSRTEFKGNFSDLLGNLRGWAMSNDSDLDLRTLPSSGQMLRNELDRLMPALAQYGIAMEFPPRTNRTRQVHLFWRSTEKRA